MTETWIEAALLASVPQDDVVAIEVQGKDIALYSVEGEVYATDNLCTHGHARLCDGFLDGHEIECPLHQGKFDVRSGAAVCAPVTEGIRTYPVRIEGDKVFLDLS
ncbi:non-heme iron oxygenase ferredoxin subunit [Cupriavidus lacunae]|uniref:Non-heme iron oxygenase ferredoxin subunit n=1 Tax=Cupriavidus lacunae TaxID=2666307 RepID=A0A370NRM1_9BURK|nr:non-heme iron oxygenase ferredoxin subunit [Cupriavidus lacunae]RDK08168.1 non-heme iron oxygenase ferredoxin subunit [Cupriavidus lacunae]